MSNIDVIEDFLRYVKIDTQSDDTTGASPSTVGQHDLAGLLEKELIEIGASDVYYDKEHCYVYASIPSNSGNDAPAIGFVSHMDTSDEVSGKNVNPRIVENYDGKDILLNAEKNIVMKAADYDNLQQYIGQDLILILGVLAVTESKSLE